MHIALEKRPRFEPREAARLAKDLYDLSGTARPLPSERDQNFLLECEDGRRHVLKIANAGESREVLDLQNRAMEFLHAEDAEVPCPGLVKTPAGETICEAPGAGRELHFVRLLTYLPGVFLADVRPHSRELLRRLGRFFGRLDRALLGFSHPAAQRDFRWDLRHAPAVIERHLDEIREPERRSLLESFLQQHQRKVSPLLASLRTSIIHSDGNDHNILVHPASPGESPETRRIAGIIDFGDMVRSYTVGDLAVAAAYAILGKPDPLAAASPVVAGYHEVLPLTDEELQALYGLLSMRLCTSVAVSAYQKQVEPENDYLRISEEQAWETLERLARVNPEFAFYTFRSVCGRPPCPDGERVVRWLRTRKDSIGRVVEPDLRTCAKAVFDLSVGSRDLAPVDDLSDTAAFTETLFRKMRARGASVGIGKYNEARPIYTSDIFEIEGNEGPEWRTVHLGIDLFMEPGSPVFAPLDARVHSFRNNASPLDYGPTIILEHEVGEEGWVFYTLYGHLSEDSLDGLHAGKPVQRGTLIGRIGDSNVNGGWVPHLHLQLICDLLDREGEFPGVALPSQREVWLSVSPDPNLLLDIPSEAFSLEGPGTEEVLRLRRKLIGPSLSLSYRAPLRIVRGAGAFLYDADGRKFLDCVNNVAHVGHCHPRVVRAARDQMAVLNTNTRYLHENLTLYAEQLCSLLPDSLSICFFVNSGSEANDLALRLARAYTGNIDTVVVDGAYHGNLSSLIEVSPYKFDGRGGKGAPPHVHKVASPDRYRGAYGYEDPDAGRRYADFIREAVFRARHEGRGIGAFICESALSCGGQIILPPDYLREAYRHVRGAGGVCIADEVQVGFGRFGSHFWGFESQGVTPDIVTLGKPIGNGHPLGAVVTTPEIAASFANGMEYFNTYGGNPVSCAVGMAVLKVLQEERMQQQALETGEYLKGGLDALRNRHPLIGDIRGQGLFAGIELVSDPASKTPGTSQAAYIVERMKERGILLSTDGPHQNVIKIKPPMVFSAEDARRLTDTLDQILKEDALRL